MDHLASYRWASYLFKLTGLFEVSLPPPLLDMHIKPTEVTSGDSQLQQQETRRRWDHFILFLAGHQQKQHPSLVGQHQRPALTH